jgi:hypothetical protein
MNMAPVETAAVVMTQDVGYGTFASITGGGRVTIYKNGVEAQLSDIVKYDVATFDSVSRVLHVSDFRVTGCYENAWPNTQTPSRVTFMGREFTALPSAAQYLSGFALGQTMTLLFTAGNEVAGAVKVSEVNATAIGIVNEGITGSAAEVTLLNGMEVAGNPGLSGYGASQLEGELVSVSSPSPGKITLAAVAARSGITGALDVKARKLGDFDISRGASIFERVGRGTVARVSLDDVASDVLPASKVAYAAADASGRVNILILDDVTGDRYTYGFLSEKLIEAPSLGEGAEAYNRYVTVRGPEGESEPALAAGIEFASGALGGVVFAPSRTGGAEKRAEAVVELIAHKNVRRSAFSTRGGQTTVEIGGFSVPVWDGALCYNGAAKLWFKSLADARAFSDNLTVYCDRTPETGGKARIIVAN